jgi:pyruvate dehydrogenase E1 component alpha subunit
MDVLDVYEKARQAVARARNGEGPTLLECKTYRYKGHSRFEKPTYRTDEEVEAWLEKDPIPAFAGILKAEYAFSEADIAEMDARAARAIEDAVAFAEQSPDPGPDDYLKYIYA